MLGIIPGIPKVHFHNPVLAMAKTGEEFMKHFHDAVGTDKLGPFILVMEGSIPNEKK